MTRLERRMRDALEGNEREVLEHYNAEFAAERNRKTQSHNTFIRQCCDQQIERLLAEKQQIEAATID